MLISITTEHVYRPETSLLKQLDMIYQAGFRGVDFTACRYIGEGLRYGDTHFFSDDWKAWIRDLRAWADARGMVFTQTHNLTHPYLESTDDIHLLNRMIDRVFEACEMLDIPVTVMHPAVPAGKANCPSDCLKANARFFKEKARIARDHNVKLCVENLIITRRFDDSSIWRYCHTPQQLIQLADEIDEPNVGFCLDVGHAHYMGENLFQTIKAYGSRLYALHVHDNNRYSDHHLMPYHGTVDWNAFARGIAEVDYHGSLNLESFRATISLPMDCQPLMLRQLFDVGAKIAAQVDACRRSSQ